jgi:hypothetical protein
VASRSKNLDSSQGDEIFNDDLEATNIGNVVTQVDKIEESHRELSSRISFLTGEEFEVLSEVPGIARPSSSRTSAMPCKSSRRSLIIVVTDLLRRH